MRRLLAVLLLAGCASSPSGPDPIATSTKTVTVTVPIGVACIAPEDVPRVPVPIELPAALVACDTLTCTRQKVTALAAYAKALRDYVELADAIILQCSKGATP